MIHVRSSSYFYLALSTCTQALCRQYLAKNLPVALVLIQRCHSYFSSILGRITRVRRDAVEQRERMMQQSSCLSVNIPSYASVATRNTSQTVTIRSIQDSPTDSVAKPEANGTTQCTKPGENQDKNNHTDVYTNRRSSTSSSIRGDDWDRDRRRERPTSSYSTRRTRSSQNVNEWKNNRHNSKRDKSQNRKDSSDRASSSSREQEKTLPSPKHKHSPRRSSSSSSLTESCGMRSGKGVKSIKYVKT
jgi:hypothetical protein